MATSTNLISGLSSGFDWRTMVDQLIAIDHRRVDLVTNKKTDYSDKLKEWQGVNTKLLALKTAASSLGAEDAFKVFSAAATSNTSTAASSLFTAAAGAAAAPGMYNIKVKNLAQSEKISSSNFTASNMALSLAGDILVSGKVVHIVEADSLTNIRDKINALNTGSSPSRVTASIVQHSSTNYHLTLSSDDTGSTGINILEGSSANVLQTMGFITSNVSIKTATSSGAKSDLLSDSTTAVGTLLGLSSPPGPTSVTIGGKAVSIDLSSQSITTIAANIDALAGISASVVSETVSGATKYRINISGTTSFTDTDNVLQILGILEGTQGSINAMHTGSVQRTLGTGAAITNTTTWANIFTGAIRGGTANTKVGGGAVFSTTKWNEINTGGDANDIEGGETIRIQGMNHSGVAVDQTYTINDPAESLSNFLSWLETQYGGATATDAYFDSSGRLILEDKQTGSSQLSVGPITYTGTDLSFGTFGNNISTGDTITITGTRYNAGGAYESFSSSPFEITTANPISDFLSEIETNFNQHASDHRVDAYISDGTDGNTAGQIVIKDLTAGDSQITASLISNNQGGGTLDFGTISMATEGRSMQLAAGEDAQLSVDNVTVTKSSNTISDVITGVMLNLVGESTESTVTLKVERDMAAIKTKIKSMADSFNSIMSYINTQFSYDEKTKKTGGLLFGDGTLSTVKSDLISAATKTVAGLSSDYNRLSLIGITLDDNINLSIDDTKLTDALTTNFDDVKKLFIALGSATNPEIQYVGHTDSTEEGTYSVNITQAATRTTLTGSGALAPPDTLGAPEIVTVKDYATGRLATVSLGSGLTIDGVVNAINSELAKEYTEQLQGFNDTGFASSTLFSAINGAENGDIITYSGKKRNGLQFSGSYVVDTNKTLGDLLSSIENEFNNEVTASVGSGKLIITDKQVGDSRLAFTINTSAISGLDFGTVTTTTEGRNAINITASKTSNKLLLTHNNYGTGNVMVVTESGGTALGLSTATQVYGVNVAGTINAVTATGSGQILSLSSSGNNANGLSINYTGTGTATADFTLSLGIGDMMDRILGFITDSTDGYVGFKQTSLQDSIDSYETRITQMEATLGRKSETLINRFVAMEMALSKLQSQSSWLSSQISMLTANAGQ